MRWSQSFIPTLKEIPSDAEIPSHQLMLRAGYVRQLMAGAYTYLPLGWRSIRKIEAIIREEMDATGALEMFMPALQPIDLFERTGRKEAFGNVLINFNIKRQNHQVHLALGPTHEEVVTDLMSRHISSYRQLPMTVYQIQTKFRNEERPRFGVLRTSEFLMKDAYSFHSTVESLGDTYQRIYRAYCRIFARCGLEYLPVEAESGPIGGDASHEFMVPADNGEDQIVFCRKTRYAANLERAETGRTRAAAQPVDAALPPSEELHTPNVGSIDALCRLLKCEATQLIKTLIFVADGAPVAVLLRGDHEANEGKIRRALGVTSLEMADAATVFKVSSAPIGFAGPVGLKCRFIADHDIPLVVPAVVGANAEDYHIANVVLGRDFELPKTADGLYETFDLRNAAAGDPSPRGEGTLELVHGIEVGHVFKLGTKYSVSLNATFDDEAATRQPLIMGCYGIGVNRILASMAETKFDANGLVLPLSIAPYSVVISPIGVNDADVDQLTAQLEQELTAAGVDLLVDDRDQRPGVKFKDADLIGIPLRVVIGGKGLKEGLIELKWRHLPEASKIPVAGAASTILEQLATRRAEEAANVPS
ncbi:MAG: proline--tRNA ligase [Planctomyces sp.]|nr:proline--tRNA ligase [Planctomyces sp.]